MRPGPEVQIHLPYMSGADRPAELEGWARNTSGMGAARKPPLMGGTLLPAPSMQAQLKTCPLEVWIASMGGVGSNALAVWLGSSGIVTRDELWLQHGCHYPQPVPACQRLIYVFGPVPDAIASVERQGYAGVNYRKMGGTGPPTRGGLARLMIDQFQAWTSTTAIPQHVLTINHKDLFTPRMRELVRRHLIGEPWSRTISTGDIGHESGLLAAWDLLPPMPARRPRETPAGNARAVRAELAGQFGECMSRIANAPSRIVRPSA